MLSFDYSYYLELTATVYCLQQLRVKALELKGFYLVAQAMANTYVEVSTKYIIPGVTRIDRLSLPSSTNMSPTERSQKITEVGELARQARKDVKLLANAVSLTIPLSGAKA